MVVQKDMRQRYHNHIWEKGYIQVYTGNGKGKTTAAFGLAIRAAGAGLKVFIAQFIKGKPSSELSFLQNCSDKITVKQYGGHNFIRGIPSEQDISRAAKALNEVREVISSGQHSLVILDEANVAVDCKVISVNDLLELICAKPDNMELVITGRNAPAEIIEAADLVTDMTLVKHYYQHGVEARLGIEC